VMKQAFGCSRCGSLAAAGQKFCGGCGFPLTATCPRCGTYVSSGDRFCENCGTQLSKSTQQQPTTSTHYQQQQSSECVGDQQQPPGISQQTKDEVETAKTKEDQVESRRTILSCEDDAMQQCYQCPRCGASMDFGVKLCGTCGEQLSWTVKLSSEVDRSTTPIEAPNSRKTSKRNILQWVILAWGIIGLTVMGIALMPLMGMLNWINIPFAGLGVIMGFVAIFAIKIRKWPSFVGTALCLFAIVVGSIRIIFGVGFI